jgi:hypothetical protein
MAESVMTPLSDPVRKLFLNSSGEIAERLIIALTPLPGWWELGALIPSGKLIDNNKMWGKLKHNQVDN